MTNTTLTDDQALRQIAKLTAKLGRGGRKDLSDLLIMAAAQKLGK